LRNVKSAIAQLQANNWVTALSAISVRQLPIRVKLKSLGLSGEALSRRDSMKVARYEVPGNIQKGTSVPRGTIETFVFQSRTRLSDFQHSSIVPSGTDMSLKTLTQSGSRRILGYFRRVPAGLIFSNSPTTCATPIATC
jgi:hypothetical protein